MPDQDRLAALEAEVKALRALVEHIYFGGFTTSDGNGRLEPYGERPSVSTIPTKVEDTPLRRYSNC